MVLVGFSFSGRLSMLAQIKLLKWAIWWSLRGFIHSQDLAQKIDLTFICSNLWPIQLATVF